MNHYAVHLKLTQRYNSAYSKTKTKTKKTVNSLTSEYTQTLTTSHLSPVTSVMDSLRSLNWPPCCPFKNRHNFCVCRLLLCPECSSLDIYMEYILTPFKFLLEYCLLCEISHNHFILILISPSSQHFRSCTLLSFCSSICCLLTWYIIHLFVNFIICLPPLESKFHKNIDFL